MSRRRNENGADDSGDKAGSGGATSATESESSDGTTAGDDAVVARLVAETNGFAFNLYEELLATDSDVNLVVSPIGIATVLSMAYAGARGITREQMRDVLGFSRDDGTLHRAFEALRRELGERGSLEGRSSTSPEGDQPDPFRLAFANAVWGQRDYPFRDEYLDVLEDHYGGAFREVDFRAEPEAARDRINDWVADRTEERITELVPDGGIHGLTRLVLANAVYFRGNWLHPFDEDRTEDGPFTALDGSAAPVPVMEQTEPFPYAAVDGSQAVDLPYWGESVSMLVILPPEGEFGAFEADLDAAAVGRLVDALEEQPGTVALPRFEFSAGFGLRSVLATMGMTDAFDASRADFSGKVDAEATDRPLAIDEVYHDTFIAVDERGTEAAAASAVLDAELVIDEPFEFVADRPFLFVIRDRPTGAPLFVGRVVDAGAAQPEENP